MYTDVVIMSERLNKRLHTRQILGWLNSQTMLWLLFVAKFTLDDCLKSGRLILYIFNGTFCRSLLSIMND